MYRGLREPSRVALFGGIYSDSAGKLSLVLVAENRGLGGALTTEGECVGEGTVNVPVGLLSPREAEEVGKFGLGGGSGADGVRGKEEYRSLLDTLFTSSYALFP